MAGEALAAGIALWANVRWGRGLALFALGDARLLRDQLPWLGAAQ